MALERLGECPPSSHGKDNTVRTKSCDSHGQSCDAEYSVVRMYVHTYRHDFDWLIAAECGGGELEGDWKEEHLQRRAQRNGKPLKMRWCVCLDLHAYYVRTYVHKSQTMCICRANYYRLTADIFRSKLLNVRA